MHPRNHESKSSKRFVGAVRSIVGRRHVLTGPASTKRYRTGFRYGAGAVEAVIRPASLIELWDTLRVCVEVDRIVIMQAANTGLTGGSTPDGDDYDRPVVILSAMRISGLQLIDNGRQVVCFPGTTLFELETALKPLGREPHSLIGSSCLGASVIGGICNNSGGSLVRRGPAYTQLALFARLDEHGDLQLVNHLGIDLGPSPRDSLMRLQRGDFENGDIRYDASWLASDREYERHVRDIHADTPARFNADPRRLFEASGSAGRVVVFAVRVDTFPKDNPTTVFYVGTNSPGELANLRREILGRFRKLPISAEYIHRDAFELARRFGKDMFLAIRFLGTARLPYLFALKARIDAAASFVGMRDFSDRLMQFACALLPEHLPIRLRRFRDRFEHHLLLKVCEEGSSETRALLAGVFPSRNGDFIECTQAEGEKAFRHRFAVAGAAVRYAAIRRNRVAGTLAFDVALPRSQRNWSPQTPAPVKAATLQKICYGHFLCHVFHQDFLIAKGHDLPSLERIMLTHFDQHGAEYPAEHNVGHHYLAKNELDTFYRRLDPRNKFNPGIGKSSKQALWRE